jgi:hypothetical protein
VQESGSSSSYNLHQGGQKPLFQNRTWNFSGNFLALDQRTRKVQVTPARYRQEFLAIAWEQIHLRGIYPLQYFSVGASLIPFLEHDPPGSLSTGPQISSLLAERSKNQAHPHSTSSFKVVKNFDPPRSLPL